MSDLTLTHQAVLLDEVVVALAIKPEGCYLDATFGRGGHAKAILEKLGERGRLFAIDRDLTAVAAGQALMQHDERFTIQHGTFAMLSSIVEQHKLTHQIDGILMDLGVSSPQLDDAERGFSFLHDGELDMRMDRTQELTAATFVNSAKEEILIKVFREYGEERFSPRIARAIIAERKIQPITTTGRLADIVAKANPAWEKFKHPATRVFQAIRIFVNDELNSLTLSLEQCLDVLQVGGRLAVISFHSLEDRIVKRFMKKHAKGDDFPIGVPICNVELNPRLKLIANKITSSHAEINRNPRSRSAVLRVAEKLA